MPGNDLGLVLPTLSNTQTEIVSQVVTALEAIETDLAPRITAGQLDIDTELSMNGAPLTNVGGVRLTGGNSSVVGTVYMDEELHAVTTAGDVQITANGSLNFAVLGAIGGDYGGANPALLSYDDAGGDYVFETDPGVLAGIRVESVELTGAAGTVHMEANSALSGDHVMSFAGFSATIGLLAYKAADSTVVDAATVVPVVGAMTFGGNIGLSSHKVTHGERNLNFNFTRTSIIDASASVTSTAGVGGITQTGITTIGYYSLPPLDAYQQLSRVVIKTDNTLFANLMTLYKVDKDGVYTAVPGAINQVAAVVIIPDYYYTLTPTTPAVLGDGETYAIKLVTNSSDTKLISGTLVYTTPA